MSSIENSNCNYITNKKIKIFFDGKSYDAFEGDTIASALIRNKIKLIGRSFKYHRPSPRISTFLPLIKALETVLEKASITDSSSNLFN